MNMDDDVSMDLEDSPPPSPSGVKTPLLNHAFNAPEMNFNLPASEDMGIYCPKFEMPDLTSSDIYVTTSANVDTEMASQPMNDLELPPSAPEWIVLTPNERALISQTVDTSMNPVPAARSAHLADVGIEMAYHRTEIAEIPPSETAVGSLVVFDTEMNDQQFEIPSIPSAVIQGSEEVMHDSLLASKTNDPEATSKHLKTSC